MTIDRDQIRRDAEEAAVWAEPDQAGILARHCLALLDEVKQADARITKLRVIVDKTSDLAFANAQRAEQAERIAEDANGSAELASRLYNQALLQLGVAEQDNRQATNLSLRLHEAETELAKANRKLKRVRPVVQAAEQIVDERLLPPEIEKTLRALLAAWENE